MGAVEFRSTANAGIVMNSKRLRCFAGYRDFAKFFLVAFFYAEVG